MMAMLWLLARPDLGPETRRMIKFNVLCLVGL